jgi:hypothetical protein
MTGVHHHTWLFSVEMGSRELFALGASRVVQVIKHLPSKHEAPRSNLSTEKNKKQKTLPGLDLN